MQVSVYWGNYHVGFRATTGAFYVSFGVWVISGTPSVGEQGRESDLMFLMKLHAGIG